MLPITKIINFRGILIDNLRVTKQTVHCIQYYYICLLKKFLKKFLQWGVNNFSLNNNHEFQKSSLLVINILKSSLVNLIYILIIFKSINLEQTYKI